MLTKQGIGSKYICGNNRNINFSIMEEGAALIKFLQQEIIRHLLANVPQR
jgi:hypothetical protein